MANTAHSGLTGSSLHEPKGVASASANTVYAANGAGSGTWVDFNTLVTSTNFTTGDLKPTIKIVADSGWVMLNDRTIGDALSGGTARANADTASLFALLWTNVSNSYCAVSGGRGASAVADYAAHKTIALPKALGRALASAGAGSGLTSRDLGQANIGAETHALSEAELPAHAHTGTTGTESNFHTHNVVGTSSTQSAVHQHTLTYLQSSGITAASGGGAGVGGTSVATVTGSENANHTHDLSFASQIENGLHNHTFTTNTAGSNGVHNNMQPSLFVNWMIKL